MKRDWHELISQPKYQVKVGKDIDVTMRDGVRLAINIFRPDSTGEFPALLSMSPYGKEVQTLPEPEIPYNFSFHGGSTVEAGKPDFWVPRGYIHVIADVRGSGTSEGKY